ncbi:MAG TPA: alpha/beta hydrolase [Verrucomicrobiae bacterium]
MIHRPAFVALTILLSTTALAAENQVIRLWPNGAPGPEPKLEAERDLTKDTENKVAGKRLIRLGNVTDPTITLYPAPKDKAHGGAVLVCPGGGYHILALDLEGTEVCERLNEMGFTAVLLKYRVPRRAGIEKHAAPLQDAQRAMGLVRQNASKWNIDPERIGILGFSAGGHLAAITSAGPQERTYEKVDDADAITAKPNFTVLIYPGYLINDKDTTQLAPEFTITKDTLQTFIAMTADDSVKAENALVYAAALQREKVPYELHIYPTGGHGYGLRKTADPVTTWPDRLQDWFQSRSLNKKK